MTFFGHKINFKVLFTIVVFLLLISSGIIFISSKYLFNDNIYKGVSVSGIVLGDMSKLEAEELITKKINEINSKHIVKIQYNDEEWKISNKDIEWNVDINDIIERAYSVGRKSNILEDIKDIYIAYNQGVDIPIKVNYNEDKLKFFINQIGSSFYKEPRNASVDIISGVPKITADIDGLALDFDKAFSIISKAIKEKPMSDVILPVLATKAEITSSDLTDITDELSRYTTRFNVHAADRTHNIRLASNYINRYLLKPNNTFSFDKVIGPRTSKMGYRDAPVYIKDELVPGIGGGICQVSSTLYNVVLLADLKIIERRNHTRPVSYVPIGQDATIAANLIDLKFINSTGNNIYIKSTIVNNQLTIRILGKKDKNFSNIKIVSDNFEVTEPKIIMENDDTLEIGEKVIDRKGEPGYKTTTYKIKYLNNKVVSKEKLYTDTYPVVNEVIKIGTKKPKESFKNEKNIENEKP